MIILICTLIMGSVASGVALFCMHRSKLALKATSSSDKDKFDKDIETVTASIDQAMSTLDSLVPLHELRALEDEIVLTKGRIETERQELADLERSLATQKDEVERREIQQNDIKLSKREREEMSDVVRANTMQLTAETERLEQELYQSKSQMESLATEVTLTTPQKQALAEINNTLQNLIERMEQLAEAHSSGSERFVNLGIQYQELEREYSRLIEREINMDI